MERKEAEALAGAIREKQRMVREGGLDILVKPIPDDDRPGAMDPRFLAETLPAIRGIRRPLFFLILQFMLRARNPKRIAYWMRRFFNGVNSLPVAQGVGIHRLSIPNGEVSVPLRIYLPDSPEGPLPAASPSRPVLLYFHGGGFAAGRPEVVEELCRLVVQRSGCMAVQAEYRLAPEHPYPAGLEDCYAALCWLFQHAGRFGADGDRICVGGDSAGGNLAAACALRDRDEGRGMVKALALLYPTLNVAGVEDGEYRFSPDQYQFLPEHRRAAQFRIASMRPASTGVLARVLKAPDPRHPSLSPYLGDLRALPPCLICCGEFDYLRPECEAYARKLAKAAVPVRLLRYAGMGHAFAEYIGVFPQAEDCAEEIGRFIREIPAGSGASP
ncbi:MAG: alpha/beta hydrolase [Spirochaetaceae bacterium]|jgi:acetyl esterase/lipase|nr:alpha/beta hydrolase [Spirochaetaceae bacterium]